MNGTVERVNRTLVEHASAMLWTARLPIGFWTVAILMATFLKNRSPTKALPMTPYEATGWGLQPDYYDINRKLFIHRIYEPFVSPVNPPQDPIFNISHGFADKKASILSKHVCTYKQHQDTRIMWILPIQI